MVNSPKNKLDISQVYVLGPRLGFEIPKADRRQSGERNDNNQYRKTGFFERRGRSGRTSHAVGGCRVHRGVSTLR